MHPRILLIAAAGLLVAFAPAPLARRERPGKDLARFQGEWVATKYEIWLDEKPPRAVHAPDVRATVEGNRLTFYQFDRRNSDGEIRLSGGDPRRLDYVQDFALSSRPSRPIGVYRFEGERLTICWDYHGRKRPLDFDGRKGGREIFVLERRKR